MNMFRKAFLTSLAIGALAMATRPTSALAQNYFAQISGVSGESQDAQHLNWIDVLSLSGGVVPAQTPSMTFSARSSTASPPLLLGAASGQHFATATLAVRRGAPNNPDYLKYVMTDVVLVNLGFSGSSGSNPIDQYQLTYSTLQIEYRVQRPDGTYGPPIITCWDFVGGVPCS
jgi:type VI secretion system secreted protein Hcp